MNVLTYPVATEKAIRAIESENTITFIVDMKATKKMIAKEIEKKFKAKVLNVRTLITTEGKKKAYVRLNKESPAIDVATQLGMI